MRTVHARLIRPLEKTIAAGHPWVYRDAVAPFQAAPGAEVVVETRNGRFLARGLAEEGPIAVRVFSLRDEPIDARLLASRFEDALALRHRLALPDTSALRLCHGEGDRLPGIVVDRYGTFAVLKLDGEAASARGPAIAAAVEPALRAIGVESLLLRTGRKEKKQVVAAFGSMPADRVHVREHGMTLVGDLAAGQKTGLFLDHRESRRRVRELSKDFRVLNLYGYTGGFSVAAGLGGASHVTTVDVAPLAIELARLSWRANGLDDSKHAAIAEDVPRFLQTSATDRFDLIVADPPNFAPNAKSVEAALASYRKLHVDCISRIASGGFYLAASCSSHVDMLAFQATIREAAMTTRRAVQVLERTGAPADHPRLAMFPEGDYLKVVLLRILD